MCFTVFNEEAFAAPYPFEGGAPSSLLSRNRTDERIYVVRSL